MKLIPEVTIVTPSHNTENYIALTIESVQKQTFKDWELLIVDDCSTDNSRVIIEKYAKADNRIRLITLPTNSGAAVARNKAIEEAEGRFIAFLDSDDRWLPKKLERQINFMKKNDVDFSYSAYEKIDENGQSCGIVRVPDKVKYSDLLKVCSIGCLTAVYDTKNIGKVYMPLIRKRQDLGLWLRLLKKIPYAYGLSDVLAHYQLRNNSISSNKRIAAIYTWRLYRDVERLGFFRSSYYFTYYAINGLLRTKFPKFARKIGLL